ncbi:MAG TPA: hypothetical protein VGZ00_08125 [Candidatus Baltobacteraceae bacterium]|jgi:hypothetical protein|nr:hypothetical protein [Candidatus Baltobacteraceae bacterium]
MNDIRDILRSLAKAEARVVVVGGVALQLQGSAYITQDIDFAYERTRENAKRIVDALKPFNPRPRDYPEGVPFIFDAQTLMTNEVLTLETMAGDVDLLGAIKGIGSFRDVDTMAETIPFEGFEIRVLSIDALIVAKRAAGRPKDKAGIIELEAMREARTTMCTTITTEQTVEENAERPATTPPISSDSSSGDDPNSSRSTRNARR